MFASLVVQLSLKVYVANWYTALTHYVNIAWLSTSSTKARNEQSSHLKKRHTNLVTSIQIIQMSSSKDPTPKATLTGLMLVQASRFKLTFTRYRFHVGDVLSFLFRNDYAIQCYRTTDIKHDHDYSTV